MSPDRAGLFAGGHWRLRQTFRCTCGAECAEWRSDLLCGFLIWHGAGEAVFRITDEEIAQEWAGDQGIPSRWARWVMAVHEYERTR